MVPTDSDNVCLYSKSITRIYKPGVMETWSGSEDTDCNSLRISPEEASKETVVAWDAQSVDDSFWVLKDQRKE